VSCAAGIARCVGKCVALRALLSLWESVCCVAGIVRCVGEYDVLRCGHC